MFADDLDDVLHEQYCEEDDWCIAQEDDGQPTEYDEWQDYFGGDDWDHGQYDQYEDVGGES